jgi:hypothetical protein
MVEMTDFSMAPKKAGKSNGARGKYQELEETAEEDRMEQTDKYTGGYSPEGDTREE